MFDLARLSEIVGDMIAKIEPESGLDKILQQLSEHGIDTTQLDCLDAQGFIELLDQNGVPTEQLDPSQLSQLADHLGFALPPGDLDYPFDMQCPAKVD